MSDVTWKDLMEMQNFLTSIDFLEPLDEPAGYDLDLYYGKWSLVGTNIVLIMKKSCKLMIYRKGGTPPKSIAKNKVMIRLPKFISLEEIIADESLDKKSRARLAWLIGQVENYG